MRPRYTLIGRYTSIRTGSRSSSDLRAAARFAAELLELRVLLSSAPAPQDLLIADEATNAVDEYTPAGTFVQHFVTSGSGDLTGSGNIRFGRDGNLYVAVYSNGDIKVAESSGLQIKSAGQKALFAA